MRLSTFSYAIGLVPLATALQVASFNVSPEEASSYGCGAECYGTINKTLQFDRDSFGTDFDLEFYATASNFSTSKPGDILKVQPVNSADINVKTGTTVYRIQYTSVDLDGSPVPATGFIALPYAPTFNQRQNGHSESVYKLAAYAHGTSGLYQGCAPSNGPAFFDYDTWKPLVDRGYAVVATDYAGLGNNYTDHKYCSFSAQASDVYYSVKAARQAFGKVLSTNWMGFGHSQGGGAVWKMAESQYMKNDTTYLGTVAIGPVTYVDMVFSHEGERGLLLSHLAMLGTAMERSIPSYRENLLTDILRKRVQMSEKAQMCALSQLALSFDLSVEDTYSATGLHASKDALLQWQSKEAPALGDRSPAPILVIQPLNDTTTPADITERAYKNACDAGNEIHMSLYPGLEHTPSTAASLSEWLGWMDDRFASGRVHPRGRCSRVTRMPFDAQHLYSPPELPPL